MFLRRIRPRGKGRRQEYWVLLESYRTPKGSRQRVVAYLGKMSAREVNGWRMLTDRLGESPGWEMDRRGLGAAQGKDRSAGLFGTSAALHRDHDDACDDDDDTVELVDVKHIRLRNVKSFGPEYLGWRLWRLLGLDELLWHHMPRGSEEVPWCVTAAILCIARFCRPGSELFIERQWYPQSSLDQIVGVAVNQVHTDRLYAGLDKLLEQKKAIEAHLRRRLSTLFELSYELLLYDLTSTYFEGQCAANPMAKRGYSRDSRPDCPQVVIALIVTADGYPMGYEVFDGNTSDSTTVRQIVQKVEAQHGQANRIWVMDRGTVSEANLQFIRERGGKYLVGTPKAMLRKVRGELSDQGWQEVREGLKVKRVSLPDQTHDHLILCRSEDRVAKESAMLDRFITRMEQGLQKMRKSMESGRLTDPVTAHVRLGRLVERNWRAAECFAVTIREMSNSETGKGRLQIEWTRDESNKQQLCGHYLLRTNVDEVDPVTLWRQYIQLVDAEWAFRISKDELELRPIWHRNAPRVQGHILVCFIAYAMYKTLAGWMKTSGLGDAPRELLEEFKSIQAGDVILPTQQRDGTVGPSLLIRCVTQPDAHVGVLLERLGLELPNHLHRRRLPRAVCAESKM